MQFTETARRGYSKLFAGMVIDPSRQAAARQIAEAIARNRPRYIAVESRTGVPWWWTGIVHSMEAGLNFHTHLHNGDGLSARTVHVPAGRPAAGSPPFTWEESADDALRLKNLQQEHDWSFAKALYNFERYNGFGYVARGINSPYLWSFSNLYKRGKYVADGVWDAEAVSQQCGAAVLLKTLVNLGHVTERAIAMPELDPILGIIKVFAPTAARLIGGPFAETAIKALADALETEAAAPDVAAKIGATPAEQLALALKKAEEVLLATLPDKAEPVQEPVHALPVPAAAPVSGTTGGAADDPAVSLAKAVTALLVLISQNLAKPAAPDAAAPTPPGATNATTPVEKPQASPNGVLVDPVASVVKTVVAGLLFVITSKFVADASTAHSLAEAAGGAITGLGGLAMTWLLHRSVSFANANTIAALAQK